MKLVRKRSKLAGLILMVAVSILAAPFAEAKPRPARVDLNGATEQELEAVPGVGAATAKKIVAGRPYSSVDDLSRAGVSAKTIEKLRSRVTVSGASGRDSSAAPAGSKSTSASGARKELRSPAPAAAARIDLNTASEQELESLPGVGAATAKKVLANRPYTSVADLSKAGVSAKTIDKLRDQVTVSAGAGRAPGSRAANPSGASSSTARSETKSAASPSGPVDLNSATESELEALPGVGVATAKKIISNRPYTSVADLSKAGVGAKTIQQISPLVTVGSRGPAARARASASSSSPPPSGQGSEPDGVEEAPYQPPSARGLVWVNLDTKIFHREGDRWYGRTRHGKYVSEAEALRDGYRESKQRVAAPKSENR